MSAAISPVPRAGKYLYHPEFKRAYYFDQNLLEQNPVLVPCEHDDQRVIDYFKLVKKQLEGEVVVDLSVAVPVEDVPVAEDAPVSTKSKAADKTDAA